MKTKKEGTQVKFLSKWTMVFATLWIAVLTLLAGFKIIELSIQDIIISGLAIVSIWSPTFISLWLDKFKEMKELTKL